MEYSADLLLVLVYPIADSCSLTLHAGLVIDHSLNMADSALISFSIVLLNNSPPGVLLCDAITVRQYTHPACTQADSAWCKCPLNASNVKHLCVYNTILLLVLP